MPTPSRILIVGKIRSNNASGNDTPISNTANNHPGHISFIFRSTVKRLANCQEMINLPVEASDLASLSAHAGNYVANELPAAWSIQQADHILGHAWKDGAWKPTGGVAGLAYEPRAFRLRFPNNATPYQEFASIHNPANPAAPLDLIIEYYVVVQPMVIP